MAFRKIDIDALEEDAFGEEEIDFQEIGELRPVSDVESEVNTRAQEVRSLLQRGNFSEALTAALQNPPYGAPYHAAKARNTQTVMDAAYQVKVTDMTQVAKSLSPEEQDVLMKYLYAGMAAPEHYSSGHLLYWHEKLTEVAGQGCIVRVITDRRTV
ncbi:hypothetical protein BGZ96_011106 [Linnemannia gamsii]|uniref:Actin-related protein 2/3 complex subunit 5 n=1 Tax=Linnemannia gamsii TaxID=64522 RepID=A0ABQ7JTK5_9FUNG|nr:hypothetical protein BGZ96_011106 [Linnemannia gamsii]